MKKKIIAILTILAVVLTLTACGANQNTTDGDNNAQDSEQTANDVKEVKVGVLLPLSGSTARMGELQRAGIELAVKNANENGGIKSLGGAKVKLVFADSTGKPEVGVTELERLIVSEKVDCLLGPYNSSVGAPTAPVAERYGVPYLLTNCTADEILTHDYNYVFRANQCNSSNAKDIIDFIQDMGEETGEKVETVALVYENTDWGKGTANLLLKFCEEAGLKVVANETYTTNTADMSGIVIKLKDVNPDVVIPMCYLNDALLLTKTIAEYKLDSAIIAGGGGFSVPDYVEKAGKEANYVMSIAGWHPDILSNKPEEAAKLNEQYKTEYSNGHDFDEYSSNGWLGAMVMMNAIERAESLDKDKIKDALASTDLKSDDKELLLHPYEGVKMDEVRGMKGQNIYACQVILQVIDGKMQMVGPLSMIKGENNVVWPVPKWSER